MVTINKFEGYTIKYEDKTFKAYKKKEIIFTHTTEDLLIQCIKENNEKNRKETEKAKEEREKIEKEALKKIPEDFKITIAHSQLLKTNFKIISEIVNETNIIFDKKEMTLVAMDSANVAMVIFTLQSSSAIEWNVKKKFEIGINTSSLNTILRDANEQDIIIITASETKDKKLLKLSFKGKTTRNYEIPCLDLEDAEQKIPKLTFTTKATLPPNQLVSIIRGANKVAESIKFSTTSNNKINFQAQGDLSGFNAEITQNEETTINTQTQTTSKYSINYLMKMIKNTLLYQQIEIGFSKDYPIRIDYKLKNKCTLSFILAPRVEND